MSELTEVARSYAQAAFNVAKESTDATNGLSSWSDQLQLLAIIIDHQEIRKLINQPQVETDVLTNLVKDICGDKLTQEGFNFLRVLAENDRLLALPEISELFEEHKSEYEKTLHVVVTTCYSLKDEQKQKLQQALEKRFNKKVEMNYDIDQAMLGGAVIRAGDHVIDNSIRGNLLRLSNHLNMKEMVCQ